MPAFFPYSPPKWNMWSQGPDRYAISIAALADLVSVLPDVDT